MNFNYILFNIKYLNTFKKIFLYIDSVWNVCSLEWYLSHQNDVIHNSACHRKVGTIGTQCLRESARWNVHWYVLAFSRNELTLFIQQSTTLKHICDSRESRLTEITKSETTCRDVKHSNQCHSITSISCCCEELSSTFRRSFHVNVF